MPEIDQSDVKILNFLFRYKGWAAIFRIQKGKILRDKKSKKRVGIIEGTKLSWETIESHCEKLADNYFIKRWRNPNPNGKVKVKYSYDFTKTSTLLGILSRQKEELRNKRERSNHPL
jgi:hypothetical protein